MIKKTISLLIFLSFVLISNAQQKPWATNFGIEAGGDFYTGLAGMSTLLKADNPLVNSDLKRQYAVNVGFYAEFLHLSKRADATWGAIKPGFGIKTGIGWDFFRAGNSSNGSSESAGLNYANIPVLLEYCIGYHQGRALPTYLPGTTTYTGVQHSDNSVTVTARSTPGFYSPGGQKVSKGTLLYLGPKYGYLFKSFNYSGEPIKDPRLMNSYIGIIGGITFWVHEINFDFSYQKGLTSIYSGKQITIDGYMLKIAINFGQRLYN
ncbi:MAG TPA: hypothetical protein VNE41_07010 [Chitinophagaceae bacterium]|nr:hypothetical protein [Chitinophagaceae bacterium]